MGLESFHKLLSKIGPAINVPYVGGEMPITAEKKLVMTLWWLGKGEVLLSVLTNLMLLCQLCIKV